MLTSGLQSTPVTLKDRSKMDNEILIQRLGATGDRIVIRRVKPPDNDASLCGVDPQQLSVTVRDGATSNVG